MSMQERILQAGKKIQVQSRTRLTPEQIDAYERAVLLSIPIGTKHAVSVTRVDRVIDGIVIAFAASKGLNLSLIALKLQERHACIFDEIRVMSDGQSIYIRFKTLPPYSFYADARPAILCWLCLILLLGCKAALQVEQ